MRWPEEWREPGALDLLKGAPPPCLIFPSFSDYQQIVARARLLDIKVCAISGLPAGVELTKGEWPGIRMSPGKSDA